MTRLLSKSFFSGSLSTFPWNCRSETWEVEIEKGLWSCLDEIDVERRREGFLFQSLRQKVYVTFIAFFVFVCHWSFDFSLLYSQVSQLSYSTRRKSSSDILLVTSLQFWSSISVSFSQRSLSSLVNLIIMWSNLDFFSCHWQTRFFFFDSHFSFPFAFFISHRHQRRPRFKIITEKLRRRSLCVFKSANPSWCPPSYFFLQVLRRLPE